MTKLTTLKPVMVFALAALSVVGCGGSNETAAENAPTTAPDATATEVVEPTATAEPPTPQPTVVPTAQPTAQASVEPTAAAVVPTTAAATPGAAITATDGASVFSGTCAFCHGASGAGTSQGPPLTGIGQFFTADASPLARLVTNGGTNMPEFGSKLTAEQIAAVADYVVATFQ